MTGGYDKDLGQVLSDMFGMTPTIKTSVGAPTIRSPDAGPGRHIHRRRRPLSARPRLGLLTLNRAGPTTAIRRIDRLIRPSRRCWPVAAAGERAA